MEQLSLETTNWLLGVMAVGSAIQTLFLIGAAVVGLRVYTQSREAMALLSQKVTDLERTHVAPLRAQVDGILGDVHAITARVSERTERVDDAISGTVDRVEETAERVKGQVRGKVARATGLVRGVRAVIAALLTSESEPKPPASTADRPKPPAPAAGVL